jgi:hypothetical protein
VLFVKEKVNRTLEVVFDNKGVIVGGETTLILISPELDCGVVRDI